MEKFMYIMNSCFRHSICLFVLFSCCYCLYEDQIGKFDWRQPYIGKLKYAAFDTVSTVLKKVFVATDKNVIAALNPKTGHIVWRQVLEKDDQGCINYLKVDTEVVTVSGQNPFYVRGWDLSSGFLTWEWTGSLGSTKEYISDKWFVHKETLYHVSVIRKSYIEVLSYGLKSGNQLGTKKIPASWVSADASCVIVPEYVACVDPSVGTLFSVNIMDSNAQVQSSLLSTLVSGKKISMPMKLTEIESPVPLFKLKLQDGNDQLLMMDGGKIVPHSQQSHDTNLIVVAQDKNLLIKVNQIDEALDVSGSVLETQEEIPELSGKIKYPNSLGRVEPGGVGLCSSRKEKSLSCRLVLSTEDYAILTLQHPGKILWIREEALSSVVAVEMLDLPVSDMDAAIEKGFDSKETGILGPFVRRISTQLLQFRSLVLAVLGLGEPPSASQRAGLIRDEFGLHKMIVAATAAGKVFGIDNRDGRIIWQHRLKDAAPFPMRGSGNDQFILFVQRTSSHYPYPAQCALLAKDKVTEEGIIFVFNPITGQLLDGLLKLRYKVKQTTLMYHSNDLFLRGILLLDDKNQLHVYPESTKSVAASYASKLFMFTADPDKGILNGYSLAFSTEERLVATPVWEVNLSLGSQSITSVVGKSLVERVHSQGRVLADRSVLYKYLNPNLVAVVTQGFDPVQKYFLSIYLIDVVSGSIVFSINHKRAKGPVHIVHSENWIVYCYYNDKFRRTEVSALELYEGKVQSNTTAFSSVDAPPQPIVERQSYIFPGVIEAMRETITEKGITSKHILLALASGGILELPWMFVDPRRPIMATAEMRDEGVIPYIPELPILQEAIINYNQTVARVNGIHTVPSGLESTCLVLVYGLDLFYTRVTPSKTFDVLKDDFDHFLISAVLLGLTAASYITRKLASKKALKQAWK